MITHMPSEREKSARYHRSVILDKAQALVRRYAWDILLKGDPSLREICECLHTKGYRLRSGTPVVKVNVDGTRSTNRLALSRAFHNPLYAGIMYFTDVEGNEIEVKGNWEPLVSREEFNRGVELIAERDRYRNHV